MGDYGARFKQCRLEAGLKQMAAAKLMGVGQSSISSYESNEREPTASVLLKMADAYHVSMDYLLGRTDVNDWED